MTLDDMLKEPENMIEEFFGTPITDIHKRQFENYKTKLHNCVKIDNNYMDYVHYFLLFVLLLLIILVIKHEILLLYLVFLNHSCLGVLLGVVHRDVLTIDSAPSVLNILGLAHNTKY